MLLLLATLKNQNQDIIDNCQMMIAANVTHPPASVIPPAATPWIPMHSGEEGEVHANATELYDQKADQESIYSNSIFTTYSEVQLSSLENRTILVENPVLAFW